jgi:thioredoxin:protein disulfide reductase
MKSKLRPNQLILTLVMALFALAPIAALSIEGSGNTEDESEEINSDPLTVSGQFQPYELEPGQNGELQLSLNLPKGFVGYTDKLKLNSLEPKELKIGNFKVEPNFDFTDKFTKKEKNGFKESSALKANFELPIDIDSGEGIAKIELSYQACTETYCLFPKKKIVEIPFKVKGSGKNQFFHSIQNTTVEEALTKSIGFALLIVFLAGILTSFTPCIFPMIPITLAVLGHNAERKRSTNILLSILYVLGIATTYSILGIIAASTGSLFGSLLSSSTAVIAIAFIFLLMSLGMFGLYDIKLPHFVEQWLHRKSQAKSAHHHHRPHFGKAYLSGLFAGLVASPCVGPVLVSILTYVGQSGDHFKGFILLFTYALGLGQIFILLGAVSEVKTLLPKSGPWMDGLKFIFGSMMLGAFYYYLDLVIPIRWHDGLLGTGLILLASIYGAFAPVQGNLAFSRIKKGLFLAIFYIGLSYLLISILDLRPYIQTRAINGDSINKSASSIFVTYSPELLEQATLKNKPVVIDFYADWCAACKELEQHTFSNSVVQDMSKDILFLKFDATKDSDELKDLKQKFNIQGLPSVQFIDRKGQWKPELSLLQFEEAPKFIKRLEKLQN